MSEGILLSLSLHQLIYMANTLTAVTLTKKRRRVAYMADFNAASIEYGNSHVMRPGRVLLVHSLVSSLGLTPLLDVYRPRPATPEEIHVVHRRAYVSCLLQAPHICGHPLDPESLAFQHEFDVPVGSSTQDCPLFSEVWSLVASQAGGSLACAEMLLHKSTDVAIHWGGGMHHAAAGHASGFCFVNDIALCIHRLLTGFLRVLYVDLDVHHGDGVEEIFSGNPRVLTFSLHQYGHHFFPGTGGYDTQPDRYAVNAPLPARTGDTLYLLHFLVALRAMREAFDPDVVVVQCGADTIAGDLIGRLCVSTHAHVACVREVLHMGLPTVLLGGGGYHVYHTAQSWALLTAVAAGLSDEEVPIHIPREDPYYMDYRRLRLHRVGGEGQYGSSSTRPLLHVLPDLDIDVVLPMREGILFYRRFTQSLTQQLRGVTCWRRGFTRAVCAGQRIVHQEAEAEPSTQSAPPPPPRQQPEGRVKEEEITLLSLIESRARRKRPRGEERKRE